MSKRKIIAAAKRKGLTVESAHYGWTATPGEMVPGWEVQFSPEVNAMYAEAEIQYFDNSAEAIEWIEQLKPVSACESGQLECGPVEHYDSEGVPLCAGCWAELVAESQSGDNLCDAAPEAGNG